MKIGVFDAGVGSFMFALKLRKRLPKANIVYLADRQSFPYGAKDKKTLVPLIDDTILYLQELERCDRVIMASNAPTVMCFDALPNTKNVIGVYPPLEKASDLSISRKVGVMGVSSLIASPEFANFKQAKEEKLSISVTGVDASAIIDGIIESGVFCLNRALAQKTIQNFMNQTLEKFPEIDVFTLSSTHLPWINHGDYRYLADLYPRLSFIDPSDDMIDGLPAEGNSGAGELKCIATENEKYSVQDLEKILAKIGHQVSIETVKIR